MPLPAARAAGGGQGAAAEWEPVLRKLVAEHRRQQGGSGGRSLAGAGSGVYGLQQQADYAGQVVRACQREIR